MGKVAIVCPGQGAQYVGMGRELADAFPEAAALFSRANEVLDEDIRSLCFDGPEGDLRLTRNTQPAILTTTLAVYEVVKGLGLKADYVAGHSLGEYSALVMADSLRFDDAVALVRERGALMEEAVPTGQGAMAAILGLEQERLEDVCRDISADVGPVELANLNCPGQIVISGEHAAVVAASDAAKAAGAKRAIALEVSGPFHSSLMRPAGERLGARLRDTAMNDAKIPVVANVTAQVVTKASDIRFLLTEQVSRSVLWEASVRFMINEGVDTFIEIGPGKVLSGLIRKIDRQSTTLSVEDLASYESLKTALRSVSE